jgi:hypothetical protein
LLRWLADQGLADRSEVEKGSIRIDPNISGVGPNVPLPLARSEHDVAIRLTEMDTAGVAHHAVSPRPFLFASAADDGQLVAEDFADPLLRRLVEDYPGHVLLGTEHPCELGDRDPVATVTRLGLDAELTPKDPVGRRCSTAEPVRRDAAERLRLQAIVCRASRERQQSLPDAAPRVGVGTAAFVPNFPSAVDCPVRLQCGHLDADRWCAVAAD